MGRENLSYDSYTEYADDPLYVVHADVALRHKLVADTLGISLSAEAAGWYNTAVSQLQELLETRLNHPVIVRDAEETRDTIATHTNLLRNRALAQKRGAFVVSLDPAFLHPHSADYTFQETRMSLVKADHTIDLEHGARKHGNRFIGKAGQRNGAGKAIVQQLQEVLTLMQLEDQPLSLIVAEDYANTGRSIIERFMPLCEGARQNLIIVAGHLNSKAAKRFAEHGIENASRHIFTRSPDKYMDQSDLIPTLGGRAIGHMVGDEPVPFTFGDGKQRPTISVDAVTGNYPWQVDLFAEDMQPAFTTAMRKLSIATALTFWESLEDAYGGELRWDDLQELQGVARIFYPMKDKQHVAWPGTQTATSPRKAIAYLQEEAV